MNFNGQIYNAKIKFSYLGLCDDGTTLWYQIGFELEDGTIATEKIRVTSPQQVANLLNVLDLRSWEELPRKYARIKVFEKKVTSIGNIYKSQWIETL